MKTLYNHLLSAYFRFYFLFLTDYNDFFFFWFSSLPVVRLFSMKNRIRLFYIVRFLFLILVIKALFSYLFMENELLKVVAPFLPFTSDSMLTGGSSLPPGAGPSENEFIILDAQRQSEGDRPDANHYPSGSSQEAHQEGRPGSPHLDPQLREVYTRELLSVLERHLKRYLKKKDKIEKFPLLRDYPEEDLLNLAQDIALKTLSIDVLEDLEIKDYADNLRLFKTTSSLFDAHFDYIFR